MRLRSFARRFLASAEAFEALRAIAWRCSAVMVLSLAFPPFLPSSARYLESSDFLSMAANLPAKPLRMQGTFFLDKLSGLVENCACKTGRASASNTHPALTSSPSKEANVAVATVTPAVSPAQLTVITSEEISRYAEITSQLSQLEAQQKALRTELLNLHAAGCRAGNHLPVSVELCGPGAAHG